MLEFLLQPWPWWFSGILVGLTVPLLYLLSGNWFGISMSYQEIGAICLPKSKLSYLKGLDKLANLWAIFFVVGVVLGGYIASHWLSAKPITSEFPELYQKLGYLHLFVGGILVGFGARFANGCTSGHAITGIANLNWPSMVATVCFFIGGLTVTWGLGSWIFGNN
jgi:uncharacterized membrane protein YedE/YeeE